MSRDAKRYRQLRAEFNRTNDVQELHRLIVLIGYVRLNYLRKVRNGYKGGVR